MPETVQPLMLCKSEHLRGLAAGIMQSTVILVIAIALVAATFSQGRATRPGASLNNDKKVKMKVIWFIIM